MKQERAIKEPIRILDEHFYVKDYNLSIQLKFPTCKSRDYQEVYASLDKSIKNAMNRKTFGVSRSEAWNSGIGWSWEMKGNINSDHKAPYMTMLFWIETDTIEVNGKTYEDKSNIESVKKSIYTVYKNWIKSNEYTWKQGQQMIKDIFKEGE